ncbi:MAG: hypothetical protein ACRDOK_16990 [Streptosporangiaceae bacterium]
MRVWHPFGMRFIDGLGKAQRVVVVIGLGLALGAVGSYLVSLGSGLPRGWTGYAPLQLQVVPGIGMAPWLRLIIWLALIALWALASIRLLRPPPAHSGSE